MKKNVPSIIFAASTLVTIIGMTSTAAASDYSDCVSETWDMIGCALNPDWETWGGILIAAPGAGGIGKDTEIRIKKMIEAGMFKELEQGNSKPKKHLFERICPMEKVLDIVEETKNVKIAQKECYREVKGTGNRLKRKN